MRASSLQAPASVGLIAPAGPPRDLDRLRAGIRALEQHGLDVQRYRPTFGPHGYLAGTDEERLAELNHFLRRTDVDALFCVRGGYGTLRLLEHIDFEAARCHPKLLIGYSDITALQLALLHKAGWASLSGPMVGVEWANLDRACAAQFWNLVRHGTPLTLTGPYGEHLHPVNPGETTGTLLGGNLTLVTKLIGTPFMPDLSGAILFLEEVGEPPYRLDGLFAHLRLSGILDQIGGLVLGGFTEWEADATYGRTAHDVLDEYTQRLSIPVASNLVYGHFPVKSAIPLGIQAKLSVNQHRGVLTMLEPLVRTSTDTVSH